MEQNRAASIQTRAYQLWEEGGREDGNHERHWLLAEAEYGAANNGTAVSSEMDEKASSSLEKVSDKPRRWPTSIVDV